MEFERIVSDVYKRPNAYGLNGGYREFVAFLNGVNAASEGRLLDGFSASLANRLGGGGNLYWALLVAQLALAPRLVRHLGEITEADQSRVVDVLFRELGEFVKSRPGPFPAGD
ncbi:hypothetical protein [Streptomyces sp. NPDC005525]|uniref:hypothetical protein n=1 Tax=Streptomyces sp. NPDC005525 TaxID=3364720 RepID=UPI0036A0FD01